MQLRSLTAELAAAPDVDTLLRVAAQAVSDLFPAGLAVAAAYEANEPGAGEWHVQTAGSQAVAPPRLAAALAALPPPGEALVSPDPAPLRCRAGQGRPAANGAAGSRLRPGAHPAALAAEPAGPDGLSLARAGVPAGDLLETVLDAGGVAAGLLGVVRPGSADVVGERWREFSAIAGQIELALLLLQRTAELRALERHQREHHEFVSLASHDLRTPLAAIRGYAQLLLRQGVAQENTMHRAGLETIVQQADRLAALTEWLLDVARIQTNRMALRRSTVDLGEAVRQAILGLQDRPGAAAIRLETPDAGAPLKADAARLIQIAREFLQFALERSAAGDPVAVRIAADGAGARLEVDDSGPALDRDERRRLFDQLVADGGAGASRSLGRVGLFIACGAAEAHGGRAWVESPPPGAERGARLCVWLPAAA